jgi:hypothetical protein
MVQETRLKAKMEAYWPLGLTRSELFLLKMLYVALFPRYLLYMLLAAK